MPPRSLIEEHYYRVNNRRVCECLSNILTRGITPTCLVDPRVPDPFTIGIVTTEETNFILKYVTPVSGHQNLHPFVSCRCLFTDPTPEGVPLISGPWPHVRPNSPHNQRRGLNGAVVKKKVTSLVSWQRKSPLRYYLYQQSHYFRPSQKTSPLKIPDTTVGDTLTPTVECVKKQGSLEVYRVHTVWGITSKDTNIYLYIHIYTTHIYTYVCTCVHINI